MRTLFKLLFLLILLSPFALAGMVWFALAEQPTVVETTRLGPEDIRRAQSILKQNDPRKAPAGARHTLEISERDINLVGNYLLQSSALGGVVVTLGDGQLAARGSVRLPHVPLRPYVNFNAVIEDHSTEPRIGRLHIGAVEVPPLLADFLLGRGIAQLLESGEYRLASHAIERIAMLPQKLVVTYRWDPRLIQQARSHLIGSGDHIALLAYHDELVYLQEQGSGVAGSLVDLLKPMFQLALLRSEQQDPIVENRALLAILGAWAGGHGLNRLVPEATMRPKRFRLRLERRTDFAQHFLLSAALSARGDAALADAVGLFKEISDSESGSGFSFTDIAADRAGTRFGEMAVASADSARRVQRLVAAGIAETDIMPRARDLPEHLSAENFKLRYGEVGSERYLVVMDEIERRLDNCRLYRR